MLDFHVSEAMSKFWGSYASKVVGGMIYHIKLDRSNFKDVTFTGHWSEDI